MEETSPLEAMTWKTEKSRTRVPKWGGVNEVVAGVRGEVQLLEDNLLSASEGEEDQEVIQRCRSTRQTNPFLHNSLNKQTRSRQI